MSNTEVTKKDMLSTEFKVAAEIYKYTEIKREKVWFTNFQIYNFVAKDNQRKKTIYMFIHNFWR